MPPVGIVMGSESDWAVMSSAYDVLRILNIPSDVRVVSAHRMPDELFEYARSAHDSGRRVIIAGAGGAAHLPGMMAAKTTIPVLGVPIPTEFLRGVDSLYSIVQMPRGIPVATFAIGSAGAANAALFAAAMLAGEDRELFSRLCSFRERQTQIARESTGIVLSRMANSNP